MMSHPLLQHQPQAPRQGRGRQIKSRGHACSTANLCTSWPPDAGHRTQSIGRDHLIYRSLFIVQLVGHSTA
jgi:hypothetical protein